MRSMIRQMEMKATPAKAKQARASQFMAERGRRLGARDSGLGVEQRRGYCPAGGAGAIVVCWRVEVAPCGWRSRGGAIRLQGPSPRPHPSSPLLSVPGDKVNRALNCE